MRLQTKPKDPYVAAKHWEMLGSGSKCSWTGCFRTSTRKEVLENMNRNSECVSAETVGKKFLSAGEAKPMDCAPCFSDSEPASKTLGLDACILLSL
mmetsp:Transcript_16612/g.28809  ORF Transcript_16612/g.28809 Transcript_16612/m.28809 type:complete len:96 (+) Transcript_16612:268-555(+)